MQSLKNLALYSKRSDPCSRTFFSQVWSVDCLPWVGEFVKETDEIRDA